MGIFLENYKLSQQENPKNKDFIFTEETELFTEKIYLYHAHTHANQKQTSRHKWFHWGTLPNIQGRNDTNMTQIIF